MKTVTKQSYKVYFLIYLYVKVHVSTLSGEFISPFSMKVRLVKELVAP